MKVGIIVHNAHPICEPFQGGLEMTTSLLLNELVNRNHNVTNGIDLSSWKVITNKENYYSWCGRICKEKGLKEIIDLCHKNNIILKIAGSISNTDYFETCILTRLNTYDCCEYVGHLNQKEINDLIGDSKGFIFSSIWNEPYGLVIAEALATGTPVLANNVGAAGEILTKKSSVLFTINYPKSFQIALNKLKSIDYKECRKRAEHFCSHLKMVDAYQALYVKMSIPIYC